MPGERLSGAGIDSWPAAANLSTHQFKFVKIVATGVDVCGAGEIIDGVLQNDPETGEAAAVMFEAGLSSLVVNGQSVNIAAGDPLESAALGIGAIISVRVAGRRQSSL
jgi:hypothetical protein